jgi:hypothetical protein
MPCASALSSRARAIPMSARPTNSTCPIGAHSPIVGEIERGGWCNPLEFELQILILSMIFNYEISYSFVGPAGLRSSTAPVLGASSLPGQATFDA